MSETLTLTSEMLAALDTALKADAVKTAKGALTPGQHAVDFTVRIQGVLKKGEDSMTDATTSIPWLTVLALFVQRSGFQRDAAMNLVKEAMIESLLLDTDAAKLLASVSGVAEAKSLFDAEVVAQMPKRPKQGTVTGKLAITVA